MSYECVAGLVRGRSVCIALGLDRVGILLGLFLWDLRRYMTG